MTINNDTPQKCIVQDCKRPVKVKSRGLCSLHYSRWQATGNPMGTKSSLKSGICVLCSKSFEGFHTQKYCNDCRFNRKCSVGDCKNLVKRKPDGVCSSTLCSTHGNRRRNGNDLTVPIRFFKDCRSCGAEVNSTQNQYCENCQTGRLCDVEGCHRIVRKMKGKCSGSKCSYHYSPDMMKKAIANWKKNNREMVNEETRRRRARLMEVENTLTVAEWLNILEECGYLCVYCGEPWKEMDHFIPLAKNGGHTAENVVPSCKHCNRTKSDKDPLEFLEELVRKVELS